MTRLILRAPSRLHFGLLSWGPAVSRQFGGVGLMVDAPGLELTSQAADAWGADGPLANRTIEVAARVAVRLSERGFEVTPSHFEIRQSPREHVGLGVGTQLGLGIARLICEQAGIITSALELAELAGRGLRSGVGLHGFGLGGLIVDGGRSEAVGLPPLLSHLKFPADWSVLIVIPPKSSGLHGPREARAFDELPPFPESLVDRLCRLVLLGLLPAVAERDLPRFGEALEDLQRGVGRGFAPAQGGIFASPKLESIASALKLDGLVGVGQSSWGPTLYAFTDAPEGQKTAILARFLDRTGLPPDAAFWTSASREGATLQAEIEDR